MKWVEKICPRWSLDSLYPPNTVYAPRSTFSQLRWVTNELYRIDSLTGHTLGVMGEMPLICHRNTATPRILDFFRLAGLEPPRSLLLYDTEEQATALAKEQVARGMRLVSPYPPLPELAEDPCLAVPLPLYRWLNDKANIDQLVDPVNVPAHVVLPVEEMTAVMDVLPGKAVFVKACHAGASGGGQDVRYCVDGAARAEAVSWMAGRAAEMTAVRVEEAVDVGTCWCVSLLIADEEVRLLGAAAQLFSEPGHQSGSRIDPEDAPPPPVLAVVEELARRGRDHGYRGLAGFDTAVASDGRIMVFDLNFRTAASTPQVLMYDAAVRRRGARVTQSWNKVLDSPLAPVLHCLEPFAREGSFIPLRLYEGTPLSQGSSTVTGMIVAGSVEEIDLLDARIRAALRDVLPS